MKNISVQQLSTLKCLHNVVMTTLGQWRSGFKTTEGDGRENGVGNVEPQKQKGERRGGRWSRESRRIGLKEIVG